MGFFEDTEYIPDSGFFSGGKFFVDAQICSESW